NRCRSTTTPSAGAPGRSSSSTPLTGPRWPPAWSARRSRSGTRRPPPAPDPLSPRGPWNVTTTRTLRLLAAGLVALAMAAGCSRAGGGDKPAPAAAQGDATEVRLGYFPNVTHAPAIIGVKKDFYTKELGSTKLTTQTFNAGPDEVNA